MIDRTKNLMIGLFVLSALVIVVFIVLFIHPSVGDSAKKLHVRFSNIDKVNIGTRVTFGGKPVGEVVKITEIIEEPDPRATYQGKVYVYQLDLVVDSNVNVYNSDEVSLRTSGLLGERSVNINPRAPLKGEKLVLVNDNIIYADEAGGVEDTIKEFKTLADKVEVTLDSIIENLNTIKDEKMWAHIAGAFKNVEEFTDTLNNNSDWEKILANVEKATAAIVEGKSTVGKLVMTDDLYLRVTSLLSKAETIMNDVNHYGVLFHLDKNWQRLRARRMNLMQKLCTPQQFKNYFNDEVDQISTSLSRVSMVLEKEGCAICPNVVENYEFSKVFSELLRRVDEIQDQLTLYNTQLNDYNVKKTELDDGYCN